MIRHVFGENYHMTEKTPVASVEAEMPLTEDVTPKCPECLTMLDWRDAMYAGGSGLCKRCHQHHGKAKARGVFHPAVQVVMRGKKLVMVPVRANRAARRGGMLSASVAAVEPPAPKQHRRTRAERRADVRKAKALAVAA